MLKYVLKLYRKNCEDSIKIGFSLFITARSAIYLSFLSGKLLFLAETIFAEVTLSIVLKFAIIEELRKWDRLMATKIRFEQFFRNWDMSQPCCQSLDAHIRVKKLQLLASLALYDQLVPS